MLVKQRLYIYNLLYMANLMKLLLSIMFIGLPQTVIVTFCHKKIHISWLVTYRMKIYESQQNKIKYILRMNTIYKYIRKTA